MQIEHDKRPMLVLQRVRNKNVRPLAESKDEKGNIKIPEHSGERSEIWEKALVSHRPPFDPYTWVTKEWVMSLLQRGMLPLEIKNMEFLPSDYPKEWRNKLLEALSVVASSTAANAKSVELAAENEELKKRLEALQAESKDVEPKSKRSAKGSRSDAKEPEGTLGETGEASDQ